MAENALENIAETISEAGYCVGESFGFNNVQVNCEEDDCFDCWDAFLHKIKEQP